MATSGITSLGFDLPDLTLEVYERIGIRAAALTVDQAVSARRSFNFVLARWTNLGVNLWRVSETPILLSLKENVASYDVDPNVIDILPECYIRQYGMLAAQPLDPGAISVVSLSSVATIMQVGHGLTTGEFCQIVVPVALGGVVIQGFYNAVSLDANHFTIDMGVNAVVTVSGGAVPTYSTAAGSNLVTVTLVNHNQALGSLYTVHVATAVGGLTLSGDYTVQTVLTGNTFIITAGFTATSSETESENGGLTQLANQNPQASATDRVLAPLSRADYSSLANKNQQGTPTSYWFNRQISPKLVIWPVPNANVPYQVQYYALRQPEDAQLQGWQRPDVPYRAMEALASAVAAHLSMKWKPEMFMQLSSYAQQMWVEFSENDVERTPFYIVPSLSGYFN